MKWATIFISAMVLLAGGCASELKPSPGMSALRIKVAAEPKKGLESSRVAVYDSGTVDVGSGAFERVDYSDLGDIVVWLESLDGHQRPHLASSDLPIPVKFDADHPRPGLNTVICLDQFLDLNNIGKQSISAYSVSDGNEFNFGTIPPNGTAFLKPKSAGLIEILSDTSPEPIARIYVAKAYGIRLTHSGANFGFGDLPPGKYRIHSWHPRLPGSTVDVQLAPDQSKTVTIDVTVNGLPKIDSK